MRNRLRIIMLLLAVGCLTGLSSLAIDVSRMDCENLLLVMPKAFGSGEISQEMLEKTNGEPNLLTYEVSSLERVKVLNADHEIVLRQTNYAYPFVTGQKPLRGSFFTAQDQQQKKKIAVLNKTAAFALFGNLDICGMAMQIGQDKYTISGVIDDKNEKENNLYIPASLSGADPSAIMVLAGSGAASEKAKRALRSATPEENYLFVPLGQLARLVSELFFAGVKVSVIGVLAIVFRKILYRLKKKAAAIQRLYEQLYLRELLRHRSDEVLSMVWLSVSAILTVVASLMLSLGLLDTGFLWAESAPLLNLHVSSSFGLILTALKTKVILSLLFLAGVVVSAVFFADNAIIQDCCCLFSDKGSSQ